ncbi:U6 snRNA-associated Sm-like protein LSm1 [Pancytospora epiphaga]|nr:U6 snRNA-associated Sm-like protein LSm1 [Pancytospora epiphaga]
MREILQHYYNEYLGKPTVILLKNNRYIFGCFKSYDQHHSISINNAVERIFHGNKYAERLLGLVILRAENISFVGKTREFNPGSYSIVDFSHLLKELNEVNGAEYSVLPVV